MKKANSTYASTHPCMHHHIGSKKEIITCHASSNHPSYSTKSFWKSFNKKRKSAM